MRCRTSCGDVDHRAGRTAGPGGTRNSNLRGLFAALECVGEADKSIVAGDRLRWVSGRDLPFEEGCCVVLEGLYPLTASLA